MSLWLALVITWIGFACGFVAGAAWRSRRSSEPPPQPHFPIVLSTSGGYVCHHCGAPSCNHLHRWSQELAVWGASR